MNYIRMVKSTLSSYDIVISK